MDWKLTPEEIRVLGCLMEKEATTPDQYPLSINALLNACNQKSNRDPVMTLSEPDVRVTVNGLLRRGLVRHASGYGGRVSKYEHRFGSERSSALELGSPQRALLCLLFLRGAQTPGELRSRAQRLADFSEVSAVETTLISLEQHDAGCLVARLPREPGKRESRYRHCLGSEELPSPLQSAPVESDSPAGTLETRVEALEHEVAELRRLIRQGNDE